MINDVPVGSLLVQSDVQSGEPLLLHVMLPTCIRMRHLAEESWVFVLDAQVIGFHCIENVLIIPFGRSGLALLLSWLYVSS